jgi:streptogramin lyase/fibronectin type 3 domain-containing protein
MDNRSWGRGLTAVARRLVIALALAGGMGPAGAGQLLVVSGGNNSVLRFDAQTGAYIDTPVSPGSGGLDGANGIAVGPDGHLYLPSLGSGSILRYDGVTGAFMGAFVLGGTGVTHPNKVVFGPDGNLYVTDYDLDAVRRFDGETGAFIDNFVVGGAGGLNDAGGLLFGPDGHLYVNSESGNSVIRYNGTTGATIGAFASGGLAQPVGSTFGPDGNLYVGNYASSAVLRFNGTTGALMGTFVAAGSGGLDGPTRVAFGPDGHLYVLSRNNHRILRFHGTTGAFLGVFVPAGSGGLLSPSWMLFAPPPAPARLVATTASASQIGITWYDNSDDETGFKIERQAEGGSFTQVAVVGPNVTSYSDSSLSAGTSYHYRVRAYHPDGASMPSEEACATTLPVAPTAPTNLRAGVYVTTEVHLAWQDNSRDETAFAIWRRTGAGAYSRLAVVTPNTRSYADTSVAAGTTYSYQVRSIGLGGASAWTNEVTVTTTTPSAPAPPTRLTVGVGSSTWVQLAWEDNSLNETAFAVWRRTGAGAWERIAVCVPNVRSYADTSAIPGTNYTYRIRAIGVGGASDWTNEAAATTPP